MRRLLNRIAGIFLTVIGAIFLTVGVFMFVSSGWTTTTATAGGCVLRMDYSTTSSGHHSYHDECQMTWVDGGATHTGTLDTQRNNVHPGDTFTVRVSGNNVALPSPVWARLVTLGFGLAALAAGLALALHRPRSEH